MQLEDANKKTDFTKEICFILLSAEREGFLLWQATSSITNPRLGVLIPSNVKKRKPFSFLFLAEREGFEPPVPFSTSVFKTGAIDHSATSPKDVFKRKSGLFSFDDAKVYQKNIPCKKKR